jgi:hypothetical protein
MVRRTGAAVPGRDPTRLTVRENRRGTLKRMPGGVGGTAVKAAYPSRLAIEVRGFKAPESLPRTRRVGERNINYNSDLNSKLHSAPRPFGCGAGSPEL